ncbi:MAG: hypothetical protein ACJZ42_03570 [Candidatus Thalassarchaeaceae archaeon]|jgi:hypothetical protein|nr:MAG: hypothetical protein CND84_00375 [Marine Group II euryarchaeote MED-G35]
MDFQDLVDTPQKVKTLAGTLVFLVAFPVYFEALPSLIDDDISGGGSSGLSGSLMVSFEESTTSLSESVTLGDGDSHDSFFDLVTESTLSIGYVELEVSCFDNDDPGPGFTDTVEGVSDLIDVEGYASGHIEDQSADGSCSGGGNGGFSIRWDITTNYTGEDYTEEDLNENEIRQLWDAEGRGMGSWIATITASIEAAPVAGGFIDNDEDFDISWTAVFFELSIEAASS